MRLCRLHNPSLRLIATVAALLAGLAVPAQRVPAPTAETRIVPGCVLSVSVDGEPEISHAYTVDSRGTVRFTISDTSGRRTETWEVALEGRNSAEATVVIEQSLGTYFKKPEVHVSIVRLPGVAVELSGEVVNAGPYTLTPGARLSDLLGLAGSKPTSDLTNVLVRHAPARSGAIEGHASAIVDLTLAPASDDDDPRLSEGDKVYVRTLPAVRPAAEAQVVRVMGEINAQSRDAAVGAGNRGDSVTVPFTTANRLRDVIRQIGGLRATADRAHLYLGRLDGTTRILNADGVEADEPNQNVELRPGDLVLVPKRGGSQAYAVLGEVNSPNTFEARQGEKITLLGAIARGGELSKQADRHRGVLSRGYLLDPTRAQTIPFDPELVRKGAQPDMALEPGDAVFIEQRKKRPTFWQQLLPFALHFLPI